MPTSRSAAHARQDEALRLHDVYQWTYRQIAERLGYSDSASAHSAAASARRRLSASDAASTDRRFGVEIEFNGCSQQAALEAIQAIGGVEVAIEGYNHRTRSHWKIITDCTSGYEIVSPPMRGEDGFEQVRRVMQGLNNAGGRVNVRCGFHVHHDAQDLDGNTLARLVELYAGSQPALDRLVAPSRRGPQDYLGPLSEREVERITRYFRSADFTTNCRRAADVTRYRNLNATSAYETHGTVEFRQHGGTLSADKAIAWVKMGQAMVRAAQADTATLPDTVFEFLFDLSANHGLAASDAEFLTGRAFHFAANA